MFGPARELCGTRECNVDFVEDQSDGVVTVECLVKRLQGIYPKLSLLGSGFLVAVNLEYETPDSKRVISEKDEIALIPPISGG